MPLRRVDCKKAATIRIHHRRLLLLSPKADILTLPSHWGEAKSAYAVRVCSPCPWLYLAVAAVINTTAGGDSNLGHLILQVRHVTTRPFSWPYFRTRDMPVTCSLHWVYRGHNMDFIIILFVHKMYHLNVSNCVNFTCTVLHVVRDKFYVRRNENRQCQLIH